MSRELIESIISNNMLEANDMVEAKMAEIRERKMYEMKRMYAARMDEIFGALSKTDIEARKKAGYKKASEVLGDPREKERKSPRLNPKAKILKHKVSEEALDEAGLGDAARKVHSMTPQQKQQFKAAMGGSIGDALRLRKSLTPNVTADKKDKKSGVLQRIKQKISDHEPAAPGSGTLKVAKAIGTGAAKGIGGFARELGSIGFSNLE